MQIYEKLQKKLIANDISNVQNQRKELILFVTTLMRLIAVFGVFGVRLVSVFSIVVFNVCELFAVLCAKVELGVMNYEKRVMLAGANIEKIETETETETNKVFLKQESENKQSIGGEKTFVRLTKDSILIEGKEYSESDINKAINTYSKRVLNANGAINQNTINQLEKYNRALQFLKSNADFESIM
ncbi:hypothetical protein SAMN04488541_10713 [Thermoflexibacter ruber]|uniref:Uncharacterized protein n=2 Tax=Thermoflexibacter ruber TaxID=1003 RepID=A0A1I2JXT3_9BACT|nr:hypothetical protein SAMN04488541_10713 [Thermoflexibacter ruber]